MKNIFYILLLAFVFVGFFSGFAQSDVDYRTHYSAPDGRYSDVRSDSLCVGDDCAGLTVDANDLKVKENLNAGGDVNIRTSIKADGRASATGLLKADSKANLGDIERVDNMVIKTGAGHVKSSSVSLTGVAGTRQVKANRIEGNTFTARGGLIIPVGQPSDIDGSIWLE